MQKYMKIYFEVFLILIFLILNQVWEWIFFQMLDFLDWKGLVWSMGIIGKSVLVDQRFWLWVKEIGLVF